MTAAVCAGGVMVTVLPGGATTVVPLCDGVTTVGGDALGAGTMTVCASTGATDAAIRPSPTSAAVIRGRVITVLLRPTGVRSLRTQPRCRRGPDPRLDPVRCGGYGGDPVIAPLIVQAARIPDKTALVEDRPDGTVTTWTYAELNRQACRLANVFLDLGLKPGERFVWCGPNSFGVVCASHARTKVGATMVPMNYRLTPDETAYIVEDADAVLVYADAEQAETFARIRARIPRVRDVVMFGGGSPPPGMLDGDALVAKASDVEPPPAPTNHPASMLYTSGTTGRPKGAVRPQLDPRSEEHTS